jgi:hypothetical protein
MDISNSLYYTFSTIAQVLAGFIALSGVFVIFKIQELKKMQFLQVQYFYNYLNGVRGLFIGSFHDCPTIAVTLKSLHHSECIGGIEEEMEKILADPNVQNSAEQKSLNQMKTVFTNINSVRLNILFWTKTSMISGLITILFSISLLPFVPWVCDCFSFVLYGIAFFGLLICIGAMTKVILTCLIEKNYLKIEKPSS